METEARDRTRAQERKPNAHFGGWTALSTCFIALVLAFVTLRALGTVLKPLAFAWILMLALAPLVKFITRRLRIPEIVAILLAMAFTILFFFELGSFVNSIVSSFVAKFGYYVDKLKTLLSMLYGALPDKAVTMLREFDWIGGVQQHVLSLSGLVISASSTTAIVLIITAFLLIERRDFAKKVASASSGSRNINAIIGTISTQVSRYLILQCLVSAATGIAVWLALWMIGIDFAITWGFLAFLLNFIPTIGSILASIPPLVIALVQYAPESYIPFFAALAAILAIQMLIGNVVSPRVMGNRLDISPVVILISLLFWNWLWGIPGALLATPFTAAIKIICDNIEPLKPVGILLGSGRQFRNFGKNGRSRRRRRFRNKGGSKNE